MKQQLFHGLRWPLFPRRKPAASPLPARGIPALVYEQHGPNPGEQGWIALSGLGPAHLDVPRLQRECERLWLTHPLVGQIVGVLCDFSIGAGLTVLASEERVQDALDAAVRQQPDWEGLQRGVAAHLAVYGEVFVHLKPDAQGVLRFQLIAPTAVRAVVRDSDGVLRGIVWEQPVVRSEALVALEHDPGRALVPPLEPGRLTWLPGEAVVTVQSQAGAAAERGIPELARILPWVERYDQWLQDRVRINRSRGAFAFLRKIPGWGIAPEPSGTQDPVTGGIPRPGSVLVVNDQESWEVLAPQVGADDASADGRALKLMILAGAGIAEHYVGDLAQSNLATAQAAELPMLKRFEARQRRVIGLFHEVFRRVLAAQGIETSFELTLPAPGLRDAQALTATLAQQIELGLISRQTAQSLIPWIPDVRAESRRLAAEAAERNEP